MKRKLFKIAVVTVLIITFSTTAAFGAQIPDFDCQITKENVYAVLDAYAPDSAFILRKNGSDFLHWFYSEQSLTERVETAVHEEYHRFVSDVDYFKYNTFSAYQFLVSNENVIDVVFNDLEAAGLLIRSEEMARLIPEDLRTFRYDTYIGGIDNDITYMSSNAEGVFGLMNEFSAYYRGFETMMNLRQYFIDYKATFDEWSPFISSAYNNSLSYSEFKFWILRYMKYAKENSPQTYNGVLNNKEFCNVYTLTEHMFRDKIQFFYDSLDVIVEQLKANGQSAHYDDDYIYGGNFGCGYESEEYTKLAAELNKQEYKNLHNEIVAKSDYAALASASICGSVKNYSDTWSGLTIKLTDKSTGAKVADAKMYDEIGTYTFGNIKAGTYTIYISQPDHAPREYTVTVGSSQVNKELDINLLGDVDMNGELNMLDIQKLFAFIKNNATITDAYQKKLADVDENKTCNMLDIQNLFATIKAA